LIGSSKETKNSIRSKSKNGKSYLDRLMLLDLVSYQKK